ncbi:MAG: hypothetical protein P8106_04800 [Gammaproteobacteria bacterium]
MNRRFPDRSVLADRGIEQRLQDVRTVGGQVDVRGGTRVQLLDRARVDGLGACQESFDRQVEPNRRIVVDDLQLFVGDPGYAAFRVAVAQHGVGTTHLADGVAELRAGGVEFRLVRGRRHQAGKVGDAVGVTGLVAGEVDQLRKVKLLFDDPVDTHVRYRDQQSNRAEPDEVANPKAACRAERSHRLAPGAIACVVPRYISRRSGSKAGPERSGIGVDNLSFAAERAARTRFRNVTQRTLSP